MPKNQVNNSTQSKSNNELVNSNKATKFLFNQVSLIFAVCGVVLSCFIFLTNPSNHNDTALQLQDARITSQEKTIETLTKTQQNDTQEVKSAVKDLVNQIQLQQQDITKLTTIIDERIPKK